MAWHVCACVLALSGVTVTLPLPSFDALRARVRPAVAAVRSSRYSPSPAEFRRLVRPLASLARVAKSQTKKGRHCGAPWERCQAGLFVGRDAGQYSGHRLDRVVQGNGNAITVRRADGKLCGVLLPD